MSVDGRITSHDSDTLDPDKKWKENPKVRALTQPFFNFTSGDIHTLTSGEAMSQIGVNTRLNPQRLETSLIVIDDQNHLTADGVTYLSQMTRHLYLVCPDRHPGLSLHYDSLTPIKFSPTLELKKLMHTLYRKHRVKQVTIHSNARLNARWLSGKLVDHLSVIMSPLLVGRHGTPNLIDTDLDFPVTLVLKEVKSFGLGFVNLRYDLLP
jgi:riboflavin biosynthesis pyrimidine reductase